MGAEPSFVVPNVDENWRLIIPDYDPDDPQPYPGDIKPGYYTTNEVVQLLRDYRFNPDAVQFIADMLEE